MKEKDIEKEIDRNKYEIDVDPKNIIAIPFGKEKIRGFKSNIFIIDDYCIRPSDEPNN